MRKRSKNTGSDMRADAMIPIIQETFVIAATTDVDSNHQPLDGSTRIAVSDAQHDKRALLAFY